LTTSDPKKRGWISLHMLRADTALFVFVFGVVLSNLPASGGHPRMPSAPPPDEAPWNGRECATEIRRPTGKQS